ncbi:GNAT family N-acetyltransferase [Teredinibacter sp. KSP-S5-2]|uniref:GNAT family N-acetyltransferase n=1 Tax=Teredinibacter sp. KSP-S5-2 TaxID=3034506 RepID=UPI002934A5C8|nr:GNAT family N-acetyltransferase [Teredinibacter sp. KSP-S5-2]WNO10047.1 GNAT family N-acetyltransferase [Teredinibacter sp. KSP-S5-2]
MEIRELNESELDQLLELYKDLHESDDPLPDETIVQEVWGHIQNNKDFLCYGLFDKGKLIGSCCLIIVANLTRGCRPYAVLENVVVHRDRRGRGYGRSMLEHALNTAWLKNCYKVMLLTGRLNEDTFKFYESAGFDRHAKQAFIAKPSDTK